MTFFGAMEAPACRKQTGIIRASLFTPNIQFFAPPRMLGVKYEEPRTTRRYSLLLALWRIGALSLVCRSGCSPRSSLFFRVAVLAPVWFCRNSPRVSFRLETKRWRVRDTFQNDVARIRSMTAGDISAPTSRTQKTPCNTVAFFWFLLAARSARFSLVLFRRHWPPCTQQEEKVARAVLCCIFMRQQLAYSSCCACSFVLGTAGQRRAVLRCAATGSLWALSLRSRAGVTGSGEGHPPLFRGEHLGMQFLRFVYGATESLERWLEK